MLKVIFVIPLHMQIALVVVTIEKMTGNEEVITASHKFLDSCQKQRLGFWNETTREKIREIDRIARDEGESLAKFQFLIAGRYCLCNSFTAFNCFLSFVFDFGTMCT